MTTMETQETTWVLTMAITMAMMATTLSTTPNLSWAKATSMGMEPSSLEEPTRWPSTERFPEATQAWLVHRLEECETPEAKAKSLNSHKEADLMEER